MVRHPALIKGAAAGAAWLLAVLAAPLQAQTEPAQMSASARAMEAAAGLPKPVLAPDPVAPAPIYADLDQLPLAPKGNRGLPDSLAAGEAQKGVQKDSLKPAPDDVSRAAPNAAPKPEPQRKMTLAEREARAEAAADAKVAAIEEAPDAPEPVSKTATATLSAAPVASPATKAPLPASAAPPSPASTPAAAPAPSPVAAVPHAETPVVAANPFARSSVEPAPASAPSVDARPAAAPQPRRHGHRRRHSPTRLARGWVQERPVVGDYISGGAGIIIGVSDRLGPDQFRERVALYIEGRRVADFDLDPVRPQVALQIPLPAPGRLRWELRGVADSDAHGARHIQSQGCIVIRHGGQYGLARTRDGRVSLQHLY